MHYSIFVLYLEKKMKEADLDYIARTLANISGIPVRVFEGEELKYYSSVIKLPKDPMEACRKEIFALKGPVAYYISPLFHVYGIVNLKNQRIVIGPTAQIPADDQALRELAFSLDVAKDEVRVFTDGMKMISRLPLETLLTMLCSVNYVLSGEKLELKDVAIQKDEQTMIKKQVEKRRTENTYENARGFTPHNTLQLEEALMEMVQKGDSAALREWISAAPPVRGGILASDQLRQLRNTFIVTATLASRAAIRGGLSAEDALTLSDAYIQRAEVLSTQNALINLQYNMVLEFTEQVEKQRLGKNPTKLSTDVANYVRHHLSEPINTEKMAKELYLSRTHLSARFRKETGMTLTDFILSIKTEEAKRLLRYSDKTAAAIGDYLGFSSSGHFSRVFRKYTEVTPGEYREQYR